jgi:chorismate synthase
MPISPTGANMAFVIRGGGRSSARLTAPVVGAAAIAKVAEAKIKEFKGGMSQGRDCDPFSGLGTRGRKSFFRADCRRALITQLENYMDDLRKDGDHRGENRCGSDQRAGGAG